MNELPVSAGSTVYILYVLRKDTYRQDTYICREALRRFEDVRHDLLKSQFCSLQPVPLLKLFNYSNFIRTFKGMNSERACLHFSTLDVLVEFERLIVMHVSHSALIVSLLFSQKLL